MTFQCTSNKVWTGCYSGSFDLWCAEAYSHPAKLSPALGYRIFEHLRELGLLHDDSVILDCMAGIGTVPLIACTLGIRAISVELEPKFIALERENKTRLEAKLHRPLDWTILQGDSRQLSKILSEHGLVCVTSPPYGDSLNESKNTTSNLKREERLKVAGHEPKEFMGGHGRNASLEDGMRYSHDPSNIGNLLDRPSQIKGDESYLEAMRQVYSEIAKVSDVLVVVTKNPTRNHVLRRLDLDTIKLLEATGWRILCVHEAQLFTEHEQAGLFGDTKKKVKGRMSFFKRLSWEKGSPVATHEDILVAVKDGASNMVTISSPPYEDAINSGASGIDWKKAGRPDRLPENLSENVHNVMGTQELRYGQTPGQVGNLH